MSRSHCGHYISLPLSLFLSSPVCVHVVLHFYWDVAGAVNGSWHCLRTANCKLKLGETLNCKNCSNCVVVVFLLLSRSFSNNCDRQHWQHVCFHCVWGDRGVDVSKLVSLSKEQQNGIAFNVFAVVTSLWHAMSCPFSRINYLSHT